MVNKRDEKCFCESSFEEVLPEQITNLLDNTYFLTPGLILRISIIVKFKPII